MNRRFDAAQQEVIALNEGTHLVLAPPGCGKTEILSQRIKQAVEAGTDPEEMLCLTFTNRAARGMVERVAGTGIDPSYGIFIGNTHRFCSEYLFGNRLIPLSTEIIDEQGAQSVIFELMGTDENIDGEELRKGISAFRRIFYLEHLIRQFEEGMENNTVIYSANKASDGLRELCHELKLDARRETIVRIFYNQGHLVTADVARSPQHSVTLAFLRLALAYRRYKEEKRLLDFDDLLLFTYSHLLHNPDHRKYSWIQVDEVQDLNPLQHAIINRLRTDDAVTVYLGDTQQAIFSFLGAKSEMMKQLVESCRGNIHRLENNYRSPSYLLDLQNTYARMVLATPESILPKARNLTEKPADALVIRYSRDSDTLPIVAATMARSFPEEERTAIIVATNSEADHVASKLSSVPHFKISGEDYFSGDAALTLISLLLVLGSESGTLAWARLLHGAGLSRSFRQGRKVVEQLFEAAISPADLLRFPKGSSLLFFSKAFESRSIPMVIFDTETTGTDTSRDDIVQIAAVKVLNGEIIDRYNAFMPTDHEIPLMLGDIPNPIIKALETATLTPRRRALEEFMNFAKGCTILGHNAWFDYAILKHNYRRDVGDDTDFDLNFLGDPIDTLALSRLLFPHLKSYKLKDIISEFSLEGTNSHMADDDILATLSLARHIRTEFLKPEVYERHTKMLDRIADYRKRADERLGEIYRASHARIINNVEEYPVAMEVRRLAGEFRMKLGLTLDPKKTSYFIDYLVLQSGKGEKSLREELARLSPLIPTLREADLCDSDIVEEKLFITTLHKAKGLEFDNVVLYNPVDGVFPFFYSETEEERAEDARKLYVALSRARKRLHIAVPRLKNVTTRHGKQKVFEVDLSPYLRPVLPLFEVF